MCSVYHTAYSCEADVWTIEKTVSLLRQTKKGALLVAQLNDFLFIFCTHPLAFLLNFCFRPIFRVQLRDQSVPAQSLVPNLRWGRREGTCILDWRAICMN